MSEASSLRRITVTCRCGNQFEIRSTVGEDFSIGICSMCHPFHGKQRAVSESREGYQTSHVTYELTSSGSITDQ